MRTSKTTVYRTPIGSGAIEFTKQFTVGMAREEAALVIEQLMSGELHDSTDKRVKRCDYCGYYWRDDSMRNTKKTCSDDCKTSIKSLQKRQQRADKELLNPTPKKKKRTLMDDYVYWLEYPYWSNEYSMIKIGWKYERPSGVALMDYVESSRGLLGEGNRRKTKKSSDYNGDERDLF